MFETIGERRQRKAKRRRQLALILLLLGVAVSCGVYLVGMDAEKTTRPLDIVQGTGASMGSFRVQFVGPPELEVRLDSMDGEAWSIAWVAGWISNRSGSTVKFDQIVYCIRDKDGRVVWEDEDPRFEAGFTLKPMDYVNFDVMPISARSAEVFEIRVEGTRVTD